VSRLRANSCGASLLSGLWKPAGCVMSADDTFSWPERCEPLRQAMGDPNLTGMERRVFAIMWTFASARRAGSGPGAVVVVPAFTITAAVPVAHRSDMTNHELPARQRLSPFPAWRAGYGAGRAGPWLGKPARPVPTREDVSHGRR
jgi:hypothetical protein